MSEFRFLFLFFLKNPKCRNITHFYVYVVGLRSMRRQKKIRKNFQVISSSSRLPTSYGIFLSAEEEEGGGRRRDSFFENGQTLKGFVCRFYQCSKKMTRKIHHRRTKY